jgi:hypothetical protein
MAEQTKEPPYDVLLSGGAVQDLRQMRDAAEQEKQQFPNDKTPANNVHRTLYKETLREIHKLEAGTSNGHHVLGHHLGRGDGRDTVVSKVSSGPGPATHRLTFREIPARNASGKNARDVIAVAPRHGPNNVYEQTGTRLGRSPNEKLPQLDRFGDAQVSSGGKAHQREPMLEKNRQIAHAFDGQTPLSSSRPLSETEFGSRTAAAGVQAGRTKDTPQRGQ